MPVQFTGQGNRNAQPSLHPRLAELRSSRPWFVPRETMLGRTGIHLATDRGPAPRVDAEPEAFIASYDGDTHVGLMAWGHSEADHGVPAPSCDYSCPEVGRT